MNSPLVSAQTSLLSVNGFVEEEIKSGIPADRIVSVDGVHVLLRSVDPLDDWWFLHVNLPRHSILSF